MPLVSYDPLVFMHGCFQIKSAIFLSLYLVVLELINVIVTVTDSKKVSPPIYCSPVSFEILQTRYTILTS